MFEKIERWNSRLIPFAIVALLFIIFLELFVHIESHVGELALEVVDGMVIAIFVVDLLFLAAHARSTMFFFKNYWLDILAVFPFSLLFKAIEPLFRGLAFTERFVLGQAVVHETLEVEKEAKVLARGEKIAKGIRLGSRGLRVLLKSKILLLVSKRKKGRRRRRRTTK